MASYKNTKNNVFVSSYPSEYQIKNPLSLFALALSALCDLPYFVLNLALFYVFGLTKLNLILMSVSYG